MQVAFTGYKSLVGAISGREDNQFLGVALRLTGEDLESFQEILRKYPMGTRQSNRDVLCLRLCGEYSSDNPEWSTIYINGHDPTRGSGQYKKKLVPLFGKVIGLLENIHLGKVNCDDEAKISPKEKEIMKKLLCPRGYSFTPDEYRIGEDDTVIPDLTFTVSEKINKFLESYYI